MPNFSGEVITDPWWQMLQTVIGYECNLYVGGSKRELFNLEVTPGTVSPSDALFTLAIAQQLLD